MQREHEFWAMKRCVRRCRRRQVTFEYMQRLPRVAEVIKMHVMVRRADGESMGRCRAEVDTAHIGLHWNVCHMVLQLGAPDLRGKTPASALQIHVGMSRLITTSVPVTRKGIDKCPRKLRMLLLGM